MIKTISKKNEEILLIDWDNEISEFSIPQLRRNCPCAKCKKHQDSITESDLSNKMRIVERQSILASPFVLAEIKLVGRYAINLIWQDGHHSGIYTYDLLHELETDRYKKE